MNHNLINNVLRAAILFESFRSVLVFSSQCLHGAVFVSLFVPLGLNFTIVNSNKHIRFSCYSPYKTREIGYKQQIVALYMIRAEHFAAAMCFCESRSRVCVCVHKLQCNIKVQTVAANKLIPYRH